MKRWRFIGLWHLALDFGRLAGVARSSRPYHTCASPRRAGQGFFDALVFEALRCDTKSDAPGDARRGEGEQGQRLSEDVLQLALEVGLDAQKRASSTVSDTKTSGEPFSKS
jgi:hypothetical protein